jgi:hypothetical protein
MSVIKLGKWRNIFDRVLVAVSRGPIIPATSISNKTIHIAHSLHFPTLPSTGTKLCWAPFTLVSTFASCYATFRKSAPLPSSGKMDQPLPQSFDTYYDIQIWVFDSKPAAVFLLRKSNVHIRNNKMNSFRELTALSFNCTWRLMGIVKCSEWRNKIKSHFRLVSEFKNHVNIMSFICHEKMHTKKIIRNTSGLAKNNLMFRASWFPQYVTWHFVNTKREGGEEVTYPGKFTTLSERESWTICFMTRYTCDPHVSFTVAVATSWEWIEFLAVVAVWRDLISLLMIFGPEADTVFPHT